jgi:UDP-2,4-diacetamido-2,4,6-trideoxy-beta-L-altropyranose hydrolase
VSSHPAGLPGSVVKSPRLLLRFDVAPAIGYGHMMRSLALAERLGRYGFKADMAVNTEGIALVPPGRADHIPLSQSVCLGNVRDTILAHSGGRSYDVVLCDHYGLDATFEREMRRIAERIVVIDDLADRQHDCDLLIDSAPGQTADRYGDLAKGATTLIGPDYALLRDEFRITRAEEPPQADRTGKRIIVSLGATDPENATAGVLGAIDGLESIGSITIVLGASAPHIARVTDLARQSSTPVIVKTAVREMAPLLAQHDLAIGAPGTSALERACMGLPQLLIETAANQRIVAAGMERSGAAIAFGPAPDVNWALLRETVADLLRSPSKLSEMSTAGLHLVDGRGLDRVAAHISLPLATRDGSALIGRRIRMSDAQVIYEWQIEPSTRRYFRNPAAPTKAAHAAFMTARCADRSGLTEVLTLDGEPAALVRADEIASVHEVSIVVAPKLRGRGIGAAALAYLDALLPGASLQAVVDARNDPSLRLFRSANYGESKSHRLNIVDLGNESQIYNPSGPENPA